MKDQTKSSWLRSGLGAVFSKFLTHARAVLSPALTAFAALLLTVNALADRVNHDVSAAYVKVDQIVPFVFHNTNATASVLVSVNGMSMVPEVNMGDYRVVIGDAFEDDNTNGVLIASIAENGRANWTNGAGIMTNNFQTPAVVSYATGAWEVAVFRCPPISTNTPNQGEDNVNFSAAYFPYSTWLGGHAVNGANGQELTNFVGSAGLEIGTHLLDYLTNSSVSDAVKNGVFYLDLRSLGIDSRRDGILLVNHGKNEANYALSRVNNDDNEMDGTWTIYTHDNRANGRSYEQDPLAFVFVPKTVTSVVSGMFMGDGAIAIHSGDTPEFTVDWRTDLGNGQYELKIPGRSPADGVLIISPAGGDPFNGDNIVTYEPNTAGDGWIIQSRDLPACGLQSLPDNEPVCSFVFIPAEKPGVAATPSKNLLTDENGGTDEFTVTVNGYPKPTSDVTVNVASLDTTEGTVSTSTLTFAPGEWNVPKTVTITGVDDGLSDGAQPYTIELSNTLSADPAFNGLAAGNVGAINIDNEAGIVVDASHVRTTEEGGSATFNVWLTVAPGANVTVALSSSDTTEAVVSPSSLTFTSGDYNIPQQVTVTGVDDNVQDGPMTFFVVTAAATSADPVYNGYDTLNIQGENVDNDAARVIVPAGVHTVSEPNTPTTFEVVLGSEPTANVTINFTSSDTTEGSVTPSVTFAPSEWNTPKVVTITAVDDAINDGTVPFTILTAVTSTDPIYAAIDPDDVAAETTDNEAAIELPSGDLTYGIADAATGIDGYATVTDENVNYNSGSLTVTLTAGANSNDRLDVRHDGTGLGQIGVSGSTVNYEGVAIGSKSGGTGATALTVGLNAAATPAAVQALLRAVTYQNVDANAAQQTRTVSFALADGAGGVSTAAKQIHIRLMRVYSFQQEADNGFGVWMGANDCQIVWDQPNTLFPQGSGSDNTVLWVDYNPQDLFGTDQSQVLLRFTNIFGTGPGQIPPGSIIVSAELIMNVTDSGHGAMINRLLIDWDADSTSYSAFAGGDSVQLNDAEAVSGTNAFFMDPGNTTTSGSGLNKIGVTADLQAWSDGTANYGWVLSPWIGGDNGTAFSPCEQTNILLRPRLKVAWVPPTASVASFQQGVDGYTGASDTQIRLASPTTGYATSGTLSPDWAFAAVPIPNQNQVLIRFDNIIGTGAGQIPSGSIIHAAVLDLTSINDAAQGAGGLFHALLKPWVDTDAWDVWGDGISADGIEAAMNSTATLPVEGYGGTVQPTHHAVELTTDVQAWVNGTPNYGWAIMPWPNGNNGWAFNSADAGIVETRPRLRVYYEAGVVLFAPVHNGGSVDIKFSGIIGRTYTVERTADLSSGSWSSIGMASIGIDGTATFLDNSPLPNSAYYRVVYP